VHVDPIKTMLKPPGTNRLRLKYNIPLSSFAFEVSLRRYTKEMAAIREKCMHTLWQRAGVHWVGRCRLTL